MGLLFLAVTTAPMIISIIFDFARINPPDVPERAEENVEQETAGSEQGLV
jgi:hypothetical protein